jgi:F-type H+-transporting ATPase subunit delta
VQLENQVDPSLIGGVLLRYDGHEIDGSVKERLDNLRRTLGQIVL